MTPQAKIRAAVAKQAALVVDEARLLKQAGDASGNVLAIAFVLAQFLRGAGELVVAVLELDGERKR